MGPVAVHPEFKRLAPNSSGWTVDEIDSPGNFETWVQHRYELLEGVITKIPAASFDGHSALSWLSYLILDHGVKKNLGLQSAGECDVVMGAKRLAVADLVVVTAADMERNRARATELGKKNFKRIYVPPTLIVESVSYGHEFRDRVAKRGWYAEFGVPSYWILDSLSKTLECLRLADGSYVTQAIGRGDEVMELEEFGGFRLELSRVWFRE